jgi:hypothetical protein
MSRSGRAGVRDAQETLERLGRTEPVAVGSTLSTPIEDLEWTVVELSTALAGLQEPAPTPYPVPVLYEPGQHPADSDVSP